MNVTLLTLGFLFSAATIVAGEHMDRALARQQAGDSQGTIAELKLEIAENPKSEKALWMLATEQTAAGKYDDSLSTLDMLEKILPPEKLSRNPWPHWLRIQNYFFKDKYERCLELLELHKDLFDSVPQLKDWRQQCAATSKKMLLLQAMDKKKTNSVSDGIASTIPSPASQAAGH